LRSAIAIKVGEREDVAKAFKVGGLKREEMAGEVGFHQKDKGAIL